MSPYKYFTPDLSRAPHVCCHLSEWESPVDLTTWVTWWGRTAPLHPRWEPSTEPGCVQGVQDNPLPGGQPPVLDPVHPKLPGRGEEPGLLTIHGPGRLQ